MRPPIKLSAHEADLKLHRIRLGDEGSAYAIGRLAIRHILERDDLTQSAALYSPSSPAPPPTPALTTALLAHFGVPSASALVSKTYADPSPPPHSFTAAESTRKLWIAQAAPIVLAFAFPQPPCSSSPLSPAPTPCPASHAAALALARAAAAPVVGHVLRLLGDRSVVRPGRALLTLGGGVWRSGGFVGLLLEGLRGEGVVFAEVGVVGDAAGEGAGALAGVERGRRAGSGVGV